MSSLLGSTSQCSDVLVPRWFSTQGSSERSYRRRSSVLPGLLRGFVAPALGGDAVTGLAGDPAPKLLNVLPVTESSGRGEPAPDAAAPATATPVVAARRAAASSRCRVAAPPPMPLPRSVNMRGSR